MQVQDDLYLGSAFAGGPLDLTYPAPQERGVGPMGRTLLFDVVPLTLQASGLAAAQAVATAKNLALTAGTGVTTQLTIDGATRFVLDTPRCLTVVSANAGDTTQLVTFSGFDQYGQPMTARVTLNGTTPVVTSKAFKSVTQIAISAATAGNVNAGFNDRFGLPVRMIVVTYVAAVKWDAVLAADAGTFVAADVTDPATNLTGDVRGLYTPSSAANGTRRLVMSLMVPAIGSGPNATRAGAYGVTQA